MRESDRVEGVRLGQRGVSNLIGSGTSDIERSRRFRRLLYQPALMTTR